LNLSFSVEDCPTPRVIIFLRFKPNNLNINAHPYNYGFLKKNTAKIVKKSPCEFAGAGESVLKYYKARKLSYPIGFSSVSKITHHNDVRIRTITIFFENQKKYSLKSVIVRMRRPFPVIIFDLKKMISYKNFHIVIKTILEDNHFNIEEYQDKYYFKKKVQEYFPQFSDEIIFSAIEYYNENNSSYLLRQKPLQVLSEKLYSGVLSRYERRIA
jgi:hypothetical protein